MSRPAGPALRRRIHDYTPPQLAASVAAALADVPDADLAPLVQAFGGHDAAALLAAYAECDAVADRPSVIFADKVKGWGLRRAPHTSRRARPRSAWSCRASPTASRPTSRARLVALRRPRSHRPWCAGFGRLLPPVEPATGPRAVRRGQGAPRRGRTAPARAGRSSLALRLLAAAVALVVLATGLWPEPLLAVSGRAAEALLVGAPG